MKHCAFLVLFALSFVGLNCGNGQAGASHLNAPDFAAKLKAASDAQILDVRTPGEYSQGHIEGAQNVDWNGDTFEVQSSRLDKSKSVFVYCLSGGRSSSAAKYLRTRGFKSVIELDGGMMAWRAANLPETTAATPSGVARSAPSGITRRQLDSLTHAYPMLLVDFYADWCAPCKKLSPIVEEIAQERGPTFHLLRINVEEAQELCKDLKVVNIPVLHYYKNQQLVWSNVGLTDKKTILSHLD